MLWFAHRVANCFIVSICYIAVAPSQTIAVSALLLSAIVIVIAALTSVLHIFYSETSRKCLKVCNTLAVLLTVVSILVTSVFFTIIFVDLTNHGLSATHVGSIIISMAIPTLIFVMSFMLKKKKVIMHNERNIFFVINHHTEIIRPYLHCLFPNGF